MINHPKRLIEVDLPIARISAHARREKSIRHGHISTLHIWWARRPLAACRAVICAALWPDPADPLCPVAFREQAVEALRAFAARVFPPRVTEEEQTLKRTASVESLGRWEALAAGTLTLDPHQPADLPLVRLALLDFIADFANWDNSTVPAYLDTSRALTQAAHEALGGEPGTRPLVVDPFAGGGSIPLEALRVGADAFASDLNPVAVLLNKVVLEYIPKYGNAEIAMKDAEGRDITFHGLAEAVRYWGNWVKQQAEKELSEFYPKDPDGSTPIAYLWARTVRCEGPGCGAEVPLMRSPWIVKKGAQSLAMRLVPNSQAKRVDFEILEGASAKDVPEGTVRRGSATCPVCGFTTPVAAVRRQLKERHGGASDSRLFCVVTTRVTDVGRFYRLPTATDIDAAQKARCDLSRRQHADHNSIKLVPDEKLDIRGIRHTWAMIYGIETWGDLFAPRQAISLATVSRLVNEVRHQMSRDAGDDFVDAVQTCLAFGVSRLADRGSSICRWDPTPTASGIINTFSRQAIPMMWDFAEGLPLEGKSGGWISSLEWIALVAERQKLDAARGTAQMCSAVELPLPDDAAHAVITDPPYYDAVPYAYLADFFYVWLRRCFRGTPIELLRESSVPKDSEIVVDRPHELSNSTKNIAFYEAQLSKAFADSRRVLRADGIGTIVFASKTTASWEAILKAVVDAGWIITASWPIDTEMESRVAAKGQARLASSVHLVCRPRENVDGTISDSIGEWRDVLSELPKRIHEWMPRLAAEGVVGADAIFACLGPALEIYSRYSRVEKSNGEPATLREYLEFVWAAVSTEALSLIFKEADAAGLEPDARLTAMWLWTIGGGGAVNGKATTRKAGAANVGAAAASASREEDSVAEGEDDTPHPGPLPEGEGEEGDALAEGGGEEEDARASSGKNKAASGFALEFDAARKIAQGLGVHLEQCESLVEIKGDKARLLSVAERSAHLFGKAAAPVASRRRRATQKSLFAVLDDAEGGDGWGDLKGPSPGGTVLDRVHQAMILFAADRGELLKRFLVADGVGRDTRFWKLADNLNKLYPAGTDERRWIEGVLARKKGLGL